MLEWELESSNKEKTTLEYEIQKTKNQRSSYDQQYEDLWKETLKVRSENEQSSTIINWLEL